MATKKAARSRTAPRARTAASRSARRTTRDVRPPRAARTAKSDSRPARPTRAARVARPARAKPMVIRLRTPDREWTLVPDRDLQREAMYWAYVARRRSRWQGAESEMQTPLQRLLGARASAAFEAIGRAGLVEVSVPWAREDLGWEARVLPWEYLLSKATKPFRDGHLTVVRHLDRDGDVHALPLPVAPALIVESAPSRLDDVSALRDDAERVRAALALEKPEVDALLQPSRRDLLAALRKPARALVHVAGEDIHAAVDRLGLSVDEGRGERRLDGLALRGSRHREPDFVTAAQVGELFDQLDTPPAVVLYSVWNSAARLAPLTVAAGVGAAIGVQDTLDEPLAGVFTTSFWRALRLRRGDLLAAFREALEAVRRQPQSLRGAGLVLWSAQSLVRPAAATRRRLDETAESFALRADTRPLAERVQVEAVPPRTINYSLLHNQRPLFDKLVLHNTGDVPVPDVNVQVVLYVGQDSFPFRRTVRLGDPQLDLSPEVVVPLTSTLIRTASERLQSTLFLEVTQGTGDDERVIERRTFRVALQPVDEWLDTDTDRLWLPSFVLPRDPAVARVIESARRYLCALADDPGAGFDGYQSIVPQKRTVEERYEPVDTQVRAIWSALLYEWRLGYINPPPSYSEAGQRLRTPTDILDERQGTCIDLSLLLAACLEYVDIWPVIFLLEGHAFPGYWRSHALHAKWVSLDFAREAFAGTDRDEPSVRAGTPRDRLTGGYVLGKSGFFEVKQLVRDGWLVPLESVWLTNHSAFSDARDEGLVNLSRKSEFHSLIDVNLARGKQVTPLPILETHGRTSEEVADGR